MSTGKPITIILGVNQLGLMRQNFSLLPHFHEKMVRKRNNDLVLHF